MGWEINKILKESYWSDYWLSLLNNKTLKRGDTKILKRAGGVERIILVLFERGLLKKVFSVDLTKPIFYTIYIFINVDIYIEILKY